MGDSILVNIFMGFCTFWWTTNNDDSKNKQDCKCKWATTT